MTHDEFTGVTFNDLDLSVCNLDHTILVISPYILRSHLLGWFSRVTTSEVVTRGHQPNKWERKIHGLITKIVWSKLLQRPAPPVFCYRCGRRFWLVGAAADDH